MASGLSLGTDGATASGSGMDEINAQQDSPMTDVNYN
jgi:hypothetical protein